MVTPRTGRPRGRPPKPKVIKSPRSPGKPPLVRDPERYRFAFISAHIELGKLRGLTEIRVLMTFAGVLHGEPYQPPENLALVEREGVRVQLASPRADPESPVWRERNVFRPRAELLRRKFQHIRARPLGDPDRQWLDAMTETWCICLRGEHEREGRASLLAASVGEQDYFEATMRPELAKRSAERKAGARTSDTTPDFLIRMCRTTA